MHGLRIILNTFLQSLPSWLGVIFLQVCAILIFTIGGREIFSSVRLGTHLNTHANFRSIGSTFMLLMRCLTGEAWPYLMRDCMVSPPECTEGLDCGNRSAPVYFGLFFLLVTSVLWQLFTAIVLDNFSFCYNSLITTQDLLDFQRLWQKFARSESDLSEERERREQVENREFHERTIAKRAEENALALKEGREPRRHSHALSKLVRGPQYLFLVRTWSLTLILTLTGGTRSLRLIDSQRLAAMNLLDKSKSRFESIIAPNVSEEDANREGFLELGRYNGANGEAGGLRNFLKLLGPPFALTEQGRDVASSWYQKIYAQVESIRERDNCVSYWHLLETLIIARLGIDALPKTNEHRDREKFMKRVIHVLNRSSACEKIQAAWYGMQCRAPGGALSHAVKSEDMDIILRARSTVLEIQMKGYGGTTRSPQTRASNQIRIMWQPEVKFCVKRCGYVSMPLQDTAASMVTAPRSNDKSGRGSAVMIRTIDTDDQGICYEINHPIVLVKHYEVRLSQMVFDKNRLELSIERLLQYSGHDDGIKTDITDLIIVLLSMNGIHEPFLLDIRMMASKVLRHTVL